MADQNGWLAKAKEAGKRLLSLSNDDSRPGENDLERAESTFGYDAVSVSMLLGSGKRAARSRVDLYTKYHEMMGFPIISTALRAHVTVALGGDERTGAVVFIDPTSDAEKNPELKKIVEEIKLDLEPMFNRVAHQTAFNAAGFGDAYARVYSEEKEGITDIYTDEMVYPPLVQPYAKGNRVVGYVVSTGRKFVERMTIKQIARAKMPRMHYVAQVRVIEKAMQAALREDDVEALPILPELIGGSFLDGVEEAYDNLLAALVGLIGQRILNSIDESMVGVNLEGMTKDQRKEFMNSIKEMLKSSKKYAEEAVKRGVPVTERRFHLIPTFNEKQLTQVQGFQNTSGAQSISIDDVMFHAKVLAGALGTDLSILGFSDILSGGLGEGGFFRTSVQSAERARIIRTCLSDFYNYLVDLHTLAKYGWVFDPKSRPFQINFYGSNSALEAEKHASQERAVNASAMFLTALDQIKNLGMDAAVNKQILERLLEVDADLAKQIADALEKAKAAADAADAAGGEDDQSGGGGPGFGRFGR